MDKLYQFPGSTRRQLGLPLPQIRVLLALLEANGPLTRRSLSAKIGNKTPVVVGRAVGYSHPEKRAAFENSKDGGYTDSLLTRGYVVEEMLDIDGINEVVIILTEMGRGMAEGLKDMDLPPLRD